jgi:hypothetical protein
VESCNHRGALPVRSPARRPLQGVPPQGTRGQVWRAALDGLPGIPPGYSQYPCPCDQRSDCSPPLADGDRQPDPQAIGTMRGGRVNSAVDEGQSLPDGGPPGAGDMAGGNRGRDRVRQARPVAGRPRRRRGRGRRGGAVAAAHEDLPRLPRPSQVAASGRKAFLRRDGFCEITLGPRSPTWLRAPSWTRRCPWLAGLASADFEDPGPRDTQSRRMSVATASLNTCVVQPGRW